MISRFLSYRHNHEIQKFSKTRLQRNVQNPADPRVLADKAIQVLYRAVKNPSQNDNPVKSDL